MKTVEINVYKFSELSESAKQKAIEWFSQGYPDYEWWEFIYEDAKNVGISISGFDLDRYCHGTLDAQETAEKILSEHGENCETYKTAKRYIEDRNSLVEKYSDGVNTSVVTEENEYDFDCECDDLDDDFQKSILEDYRIMLRQEYEHLTSEQHIIEMIEINEYEFTEDGERF